MNKEEKAFVDAVKYPEPKPKKARKARKLTTGQRQLNRQDAVRDFLMNAIHLGSEYPAVLDVDKDSFKAELRYHETTFSDLEKLSIAFGTKDINLGTERRDDGYCETCSYSYTVNTIRVESITKWPEGCEP